MTMKKNAVVVLSLAGWLAVVASCNDSIAPSNNEGQEPPSVVADSTSALSVMDALRQQHRFAPALVLAGRAPTSTGSVIGSPLDVTFQRPGGFLTPTFNGAAASSKTWRLSLPSRSTDAFRIEETASGVALSPRLLGARPADAEPAGGYVVYRGASAEGGTFLHRITDDGTEDYITFDREPAAKQVVYSVDLSPAVAGLRLVGGTLEAVDGSGTPRLRVASPYLVGADGQVVEAALDVAGCNVDASPGEPWDRPTVAPGASTCQVRVSWEGAQVAYPAVLDPSWSTTASMSRTRWQAATSTLPNGRVLVSGGETTGNITTRTAEIYDTTSRTWATTASMSTARQQHRSVRIANGTVMVTGGIDEATFTVWATTEAYNQTSGTWSALATMPNARRDHTMTLLANSDILVTGGTVGQVPQTRSEIYNHNNNTWAATTNMLVGQEKHTATLLNNGNVLVVGFNAPGGQLFNTSSATWTSTPGLAVPRQSHTATLLTDGTVLIAGGDGTDPVFGGGFGSVRAAEIFNPTTGSWTRTGATTYGHTVGTANRLGAGTVLLVGEDDPGSPRTTPEIFNPTWGTWTLAPAITTPRGGHISRNLINGRILIAGGSDINGNLTATAEEFVDTVNAVNASEYKLAAAVDPDVLSDRATEEWAVLHRPATLTAGTRYPLLVFLHGNHPTCGHGTNPRIDDNAQYTTTGTCPAGDVVVPSHRGYDYIASDLASRGYLVVSINANRGINDGAGISGDGGLNLARGRLILKHLQRLSEWDRGVSPTPSTLGVSLQNHIDFSQVGLMGHSRGGEGVRAAYQQYRDAGSIWPGRIVTPVNFRAIFEIGPVDGQTSRILNADNTKWGVILPMCDGDVYDLEGMKPYDRMNAIFNETNPTFKTTYNVWGACHNYYNTEWQQADSTSCSGDHRPLCTSGTGISGSPEQRQTGFYPMLAFFTGNVGPAANPVLNNWFDPKARILPDPPVYRGYTPGANTSQNRQLEDFTGPTGTSTFGQPNIASQITISHESVPEHDSTFRAANISWGTPGPSTFFQSNWAAVGSGFNLSSYQMLDIRVDRIEDTFLNPSTDSTVEVALVTSTGALSSSTFITNYGNRLNGPRSGPFNFHTMLQTVRIPLTDFGVSLTSIRGVRLTFSLTPTGHIYVGSIRATKVTTPPVPLMSPLVAQTVPGASASLSSAVMPGSVPESAPAGAAAAPPAGPQLVTSGNALTSVRSTPDGASVQVAVSSPVIFDARAQLLTLRIGSVESNLSAYPGGDLRNAVFTLPRADWDRLVGGEPITVRYGSGTSPIVWSFGGLDKTQLNR